MRGAEEVCRRRARRRIVVFRARTRPRGSGCRAAVSRFERGADGFAQVLTALYASDLVTELTISAHDRDRDRARTAGHL